MQLVSPQYASPAKTRSLLRALSLGRSSRKSPLVGAAGSDDSRTRSFLGQLFHRLAMPDQDRRVAETDADITKHQGCDTDHSFLLVLPSWPPSSRGILSPSLLDCLHHFVRVRRWPNLIRREEPS